MLSPPKATAEEYPLSLQERRMRNIQKNQEFLLSLMESMKDSSLAEVAAVDDEVSASSKAGNSVVDNNEPNSGHQPFLRNGLLFHQSEMCSMFRHRESQILCIYRYLERFAFKRNSIGHFPSAILHGGSGKSSIIETILDQENIPHVSVNCSQYSTNRHLLHFMYYELMSTVKQNIHKKRSRQSNQALRDLQSIQSMSCSAVHEFANALIETSKVLERGGYHRFAIVMMNFNAVSGFAEPDSMKQLLSMLDIQSCFSFFLISSSISNINHDLDNKRFLLQRPFLISFPPYDSNQVQDIVTDILLRKLHILEANNNYAGDEGDGCVVDIDFLEYKRNLGTQCKKILQFVCEHSLPLITLIHNKINVAVSIIEAIWIVLYDGTITEVLGRQINSFEGAMSEILTSNRHSPKRPIMVSSGTALEAPKVWLVKSLTEELLKLNSFNLSNNQRSYLRQKFVEEKTMAKLKNDNSNTGIYHINPTTVPLRMRCLMIACYLATHNPKESDNLKFVGDRAKKRKSSEIASSNNSNPKETFSSINTTGSSSSGASTRTNKVFSLERLMSIYGQVLHICTMQHIDALYGDANIHAMVNSLVEKHLLCRATSWKLSRAMYSSNIPRSLVDSISKSIQFPIGHFVLNNFNQVI